MIKIQHNNAYRTKGKLFLLFGIVITLLMKNVLNIQFYFYKNIDKIRSEIYR